MKDLGRVAHDAAETAIEELFEDDECCCVTCIVRTVLDAAWPYLREAALQERPDWV